MHPIQTRFTKLLNVKTPIISAPMYYASTPELAAAVSDFGGLGFIAAGFSPPSQLKEELGTIRTKLNIPPGSPILAGVGFIGWILDITEASDEPRIQAVLDECPTAIWFAFGVDLGKYVAQVREYDAKREHKTIIFVMVHSLEQALHAANDWKVDVIVVQGIEAGGHGHSKAPLLSILLTAVTTALPNGPVILAAGGVNTGAHIAGLLTMGADGVVVGTRFLYTPECMYSEEIKSVLLDAGFNSTLRGHMFDEVNRTAFWPEGYNGRAIANKIVDDCQAGLDLEERLKRCDEGKTKGEKDRLIIWAGEGVGYVKQIKSTKEVVEELHNGTVTALTASWKLIN